jgi:hypothetical protein
MRTLAFVLVSCAVLAPAPAAAEECPFVGQDPKLCDPTVKVILDRNPEHTAGPGKCDVIDVDPDPVIAYPGHTITWLFENRCGRAVKAKIGKRRPKYPKSTQGEPLTTTSDLPAVPYNIPHATTGKVTVGVRTGATARLYKYDIEGDNDIETDPEIDVRRGGGGLPPPAPVASPSPSPSPRGNEP